MFTRTRLCREPGRFARWTMVGSHQVCEPDDALCRNPEAARLLAEAIVRDGRALEADRIPVGSPLIPALREALGGKGPPLSAFVDDQGSVPSAEEPLSRTSRERRGPSELGR